MTVAEISPVAAGPLYSGPVATGLGSTDQEQTG